MVAHTGDPGSGTVQRCIEHGHMLRVDARQLVVNSLPSVTS